jgi:hypothetical protein
MAHRSPLVALVALLLAAGCEKSGPKASGEASAEELAALAAMPRNADFAFGGNFLRLQKYLAQTPLGKVMNTLEAAAPGMKRWTDCLGDNKDLVMVGTVEAATSVELRFVMTHITIDDLEKCAKAAEFTATVDPDRKYIAIQVSGDLGTKLGYLVIPNGIYGKQTLKVGMAKAEAVPLDRARFEADLAAAKQDNATQNTNLMAAIAKVDRTKAMWFAGNAAATPIGTKVGEVFGSLDFGDGMKIDVLASMKEEKLAKQIVTGFEDAKDAAGLLGADMKGILNSIKITLDGSQLRFRLELTNAQLETLLSKMAPMMGGRGRQ